MKLPTFIQRYQTADYVDPESRSHPPRSPILTGLVTLAMVSLMGCGSVGSLAATRAPADVATVSVSSVGPSGGASSNVRSAPSKAADLGVRAAVAVEVAPQFRSGRLAEPRTLTVPGGFRASVFAAGLNSPRFMAIGPNGTIFATGIGGGQVYALPDADGDGVADEIQVWADGLRQPHGLAFHEGYLYVGETNQIVRFRVGPDGTRQSAAELVIPNLPSGGGHRTRTVGFSPDGKFFVSVGSSCNVCDEADERRAAISVYNPDGSDGRVFMRGLRNAVGFVWRPGTDEIYATNNGRDQIGDDVPLETVYRVRDGGDAGWPRCNPTPQGQQLDPQFGVAGYCETVDPPAATFGAHTAPLGLRSYDGTMLPETLHGDLFVAVHGSWNRSVPAGYKVIRIPFANGVPGQAEDFLTGWMSTEGNRASVWGRPVDVLVAPDGALLVSDDDGGAIFRISYAGG